MKWSKFNFMFQSERFGCFIYNSQTNSFLKLNNELYNFLVQSKDDIASCEKILSKNTYETFILNKVITYEDDESDFYLKKKYLRYKHNFDSETLGLVIAPTTACNFTCPYCYEKGINHEYMNDKTINAIVDFIAKSSSNKAYLTWYGGEPLLHFSAIKSIVDRVINLKKFNSIENVLVTNGYLLNSDVCNFFADKQLSIIQITIDGLKATHDEMRRHKSGKGSFDVILNNIDIAVNILPNTKFVIRVNISNNNKADFYLLSKFLSDRWKGKNIYIVPCYVNDHGNCQVDCCSNQEKVAFYSELYKKHNFKIDFYPRYQIGGCTATNINNFIIDPVGDMYKCWVDIGKKDRLIGSIFTDTLVKNHLSKQYILEFDMFNDDKCKDCFMFPVCDGGCAWFRLQNKKNGTNYNLCPIDPDDLTEYLEIEYEKRLQKANI